MPVCVPLKMASKTPKGVQQVSSVANISQHPSISRYIKTNKLWADCMMGLNIVCLAVVLVNNRTTLCLWNSCFMCMWIMCSVFIWLFYKTLYQKSKNFERMQLPWSTAIVYDCLIVSLFQSSLLKSDFFNESKSSCGDISNWKKPPTLWYNHFIVRIHRVHMWSHFATLTEHRAHKDTTESRAGQPRHKVQVTKNVLF